MQHAELEALMEALAAECGQARTYFGLYDQRKVTFRIESSSVISSDSDGCTHVEAIGEMRFDFGIEADGEWTRRETVHPVRFELEACETPIAVESSSLSAELLGWLTGRWSAEEEVLLCEPKDERGRARRVRAPRPPADYVEFRVERVVVQPERAEVPPAPAER